MKPLLTCVDWLISHLASGTSPRSLQQFLAAQKTMWIVAAVCVSPGVFRFSFWDIWDVSKQLDVCFLVLSFLEKHMVPQKRDQDSKGNESSEPTTIFSGDILVFGEVIH